jgi:hypothetical protein
MGFEATAVQIIVIAYTSLLAATKSTKSNAGTTKSPRELYSAILEDLAGIGRESPHKLLDVDNFISHCFRQETLDSLSLGFSRKVVWYHVFFANREMVIGTTTSQQKCKDRPLCPRDGEAPRLIYLLGPVAVVKRAKDDFSWTQSIG